MNTSLLNKRLITLAALLHDIGKLVQRSKRHLSSYHVPNMRHDRIGSVFVQGWEKDLGRSFPEVRRLINDHHESYSSTDINEKLLILSDWLSAGERTTSEDVEEMPGDAHLSSIFSSLFENEGDVRRRYYSISKLSMDSIFPHDEPKAKPGEYDSLLDELLKEDVNMEHFPFSYNLFGNQFLERLYFICEKYLWSIPAQTPFPKHPYLPDISLFDHLRTTAAIATSLWYELEGRRLTEEEIQSALDSLKRVEFDDLEKARQDDALNKSPFLLVCGDMSGIQDFITSTPSKMAAKALKGRSLYLELLMELIAKHILKELDLSMSNLLYVGGGNFYVLAPASAEGKLEEIRVRISQLLLNAHGGEIYLALGWTPVRLYEFLKGGMAEVWDGALKEAGKRKVARFSELGLGEKFGEIFGPFSPGREDSKVGICRCCHLEREFDPDARQEEEKICQLCHSFTEMPKKLRKANFYTEKDVPPSITGEFKGYQDVFRALGFEADFSEEVKNGARRYRLNDTELNSGATGFYFVPIGVPIGDDGEVKDFDTLAEEATGLKKLGYVKLDVDNLGVMFRDGLKFPTISRLASLSRMLEMFFSGYVNKIGSPNKLSIIFSGGDDTFVVGSWDSIYEFMGKLRKSFKSFVTDNPYVTISTAFAIFDPKFPISRAYGDIEGQLDLAKERENGRGLKNYPNWREKNRVAVLGYPLGWDDEFKRMEELRQRIEKVGGEEALAIARRISRATGGFEAILKDSMKGMIKLQKVWRFAHFLRKGKGTSPELVEDLVNWNERVIIGNIMKYERIESPYILPLAARLVDFRLRKE